MINIYWLKNLYRLRYGKVKRKLNLKKSLLKNKLFFKFNLVLPAGLEPTTPRFAAWCSSNWAMGAKILNILSKKLNYAIY